MRLFLVMLPGRVTGRASRSMYSPLERADLATPTTRQNKQGNDVGESIVAIDCRANTAASLTRGSLSCPVRSRFWIIGTLLPGDR